MLPIRGGYRLSRWQGGYLYGMLLVATHAQAQTTARFWISGSATNPNAPAPSVSVGHNGVLHVWAQPALGQPLQNVSLNLVADVDEQQDTLIEFIEGQINVINNPVTAGSARFQITSDSNADLAFPSLPPLQIDPDFPDTVRGFGGVSIYELGGPGASYTGITQVSHFASLGYRAIGEGSVDLHLQIGPQGCTPFEGVSSDVIVQFGVLGEHTYQANRSNREYTCCGDSPDATLLLTAATGILGDGDGDGVVDLDDYEIWKSDFGTDSTRADYNGNGVVDLGDYAVWRDNLGATAPSFQLSQTIPEPSSLLLLGVATATMATFNRRKKPRSLEILNPAVGIEHRFASCRIEQFILYLHRLGRWLCELSIL
jgi:hypothetical protein